MILNIIINDANMMTQRILIFMLMIKTFTMITTIIITNFDNHGE